MSFYFSKSKFVDTYYACNKYYNESLQTYVLGKNYDARFNVNLKKIGMYFIIEYSLTSVDPLYIKDDEYIEIFTSGNTLKENLIAAWFYEFEFEEP